MTDPGFKDHEITVLVRFETGLLEIPGDLLDRRFSFGTGEDKVEVRLPREGPHAEHNGSRVGPKLFRISELLVALFPTQTTTFPDPLPESLPLAIKADSRIFEELVQVAKAEARRAYEAFDRFSRTLRWKSMNTWILRQESAPRTQWQTNVVLRSTEQPVRGVAGSELAMVPFTITVEQWEQAAGASSVTQVQDPSWRSIDFSRPRAGELATSSTHACGIRSCASFSRRVRRRLSRARCSASTISVKRPSKLSAPIFAHGATRPEHRATAAARWRAWRGAARMYALHR